MSESRTPHSLRIILFLLRITLGLNFFYVGVSKLFGPIFGTEAGTRPLPDLAAWMNATAGPSLSGAAFQTFWAWVALVVGLCLVLGIVTRLAAIVGIGLTLASYAPLAGAAPLTPLQFANDGTLVTLCFLAIIFSNAGEYLGLDRFVHVHLSGSHKK